MKINIEDAKWFFPATFRHVYDGDSVTAYDLDFGFGFSKKTSRGSRQGIRLYGIDADKLSTPSGEAARQFLNQLDEKNVLLRSHKFATGKYGRYLFEVFVPAHEVGLPGDDYVNVNKHMVDAGLVEPLFYESDGAFTS